jgi:predicted alpha/beta-fold hydrolase
MTTARIPRRTPSQSKLYGDSFSSQSDWFVPFQPIPLLRNAHAQTLAGNYWRRPPIEIRADAEVVEVDSADGSRVLCHGHWQPEPVRAARLTMLLVHGLEGSSDSRYMLGIAAQAWRGGCNIIRMNMRNCGGTEEWTPTLYHSALSQDVHAVLRHYARRFQLERMAMVGYSMGGNLVLKLAGELGDEAPEWLKAAVAVSPAADLAPSADALHERANRVYEAHFLRNLMRRFRRKAALFPALYSTSGIGPVRSVREFDDRITAPYSGFAGADDYYYRASAARVVSRVAIPTLVIHAQDDPFIRMTANTRERMTANQAITLLESDHGGHCAFLARTDCGKMKDRHWAESTLVRYLLATAGHGHGN